MIELKFYGPHSESLAQFVITPTDCDQTFIGKGVSKLEALENALAVLEIETPAPRVRRAAMSMLPARPEFIEGDDQCSVWCVLGVNDGMV